MDIEKIYATYYLQVYSYVMGLVKAPTLAEDITQQTFEKAMHASYDGRAKASTWLCAIAKNLCMDHFRRSGRTVPLEEAAEEMAASGEESLVRRETTLAIHKILHTLPEPYKEVFQLRVFGELAFKDIAAIFGKSESWARVTYHRARLQIKERMNDDE